MLQQQFPPLILASKSPRRKDLLNQLGFTFEIVLQDVEENFPDELDKKEVPSFLAKKKATAIQDHLKDNQTVIVASDTIVLMDDTIYHKPTDTFENVNQEFYLRAAHAILDCILALDTSLN